MSCDFLLTVDDSGSRDLHQTATMIRDRLLTLAIRGTRWSVRSPSDKRRYWMTWSHLQQQRKIGRLQIKENHNRGSRSQFDCGPIVTRSWPDSPTIGAKSSLNQGRFVAELKPRGRPMKTASTTPPIRSYDRVNCPRFLGQNPL